MKLQFLSKSVDETNKFASTFARTIMGPCVVSLKGDLGAGKTTFAKGFAESLGIIDNVTSPTFTILNEYDGGKFPLYHFDMYRLSSQDEAKELGFLDYFDLSRLDGIVLCEWAENTPGILPKCYYEITLEKCGNSERKISIEEVVK